MKKFFFKNEDGSIICNACARHCRINQGEVGYCGVRKNEKGQVLPLNSGLFIFLKIEDTTLYVGGIGSNMRFSFDENWDTSLYPYLKTKEVGREEVNKDIQSIGYRYSPKDLNKYAKKKGCRRIVFQYNEPVVNIEYVGELLEIGDIDVGIVSNGYFSKDFVKDILPLLYSIDIFLFSTFDKFYFKHSRAQLNIIKENIKIVYGGSKKLRIICPLISGENDSYEDILSLVSFLDTISNEIPLVFRKYYPSYRMVDKVFTTHEKLNKARIIALKKGLQSVILE